MKFYETFAALSLFLFTTGNAALPVQADHHVEKSNSIDAVVAHKQEQQQRILNSIVGLSGVSSSRVLVSNQCILDAALVTLNAALDYYIDQTTFEKELEDSCKEADGEVVKVSVDFTDPSCSTTTAIGAAFSEHEYFCVPGSCGGSSAQDVVTEYVNMSIEGQEDPPADDSCKDFEVKVGGDTSAAGAQYQYLSSLSFFLIQGVIVSSFMVVML
jgi:hypothetical protein